MQEQEWMAIRDWFRNYEAGFAGPDGTLDPLLRLKSSHSRRVAADARDLALELDWAADPVRLAQAAGLLHDVGRFTQFRDFGTFSDPKSVNHGERGWEVLRRDPAFNALPIPRRNDLLTAVRYHNRRVLPDGLPAEALKLTHVVRDADKLDIFEVILGALRGGAADENPGILLSVPPEGPPNPAILDAIRNGRTAAYEDIRNRTDFGLQMLSWAFDLKFEGACRRMIDRGLFDELIGRLPGESGVREAAALARAQLFRRRVCDTGPDIRAPGRAE